MSIRLAPRVRPAASCCTQKPGTAPTSDPYHRFMEDCCFGELAFTPVESAANSQRFPLYPIVFQSRAALDGYLPSGSAILPSSWRLTNQAASKGRRSHCSSGERPMPRTGTTGMPSAYLQLQPGLSEASASCSTATVMATPTPTKEVNQMGRDAESMSAVAPPGPRSNRPEA